MSIVPSEVVPDKAKSEPVNPVTTDFPVKMPRRRRVRIRQSRNYRRDTMLTLFGTRTRFCDGVSRRNFLKIGALGLGGLALPQILQAEAVTGTRR